MSGFSFDTWKYMFPERILERGEDYYYDGAIDHICRTNHGYQAVAHGSDDYEVAITIKNNRITEMYCDCPYAQDGNNCKHMAALLFELTEGDASLAVIESEKDSKETVDDIIDRMSEEQLKKELKLIAQEQIHVSDRIISRYRSKKADENEVIRIFYALDSLADEYGDRDGFIDWRHGFDYVHGFESCLDDMVQPLIDQQEYMIAFKALDKVFYVLNHVEMDGSGGEHGEIEDVIKDYWMQIIPLASPEEQDQMHDWFMDMYQNDHDLITTEAIEEVLENSFDDLKYVLPLLEKVRNQLNDSQTEGYKISGLLEKYPNLLERCGKSTKEYEQWLNDHSDLETVKRIRLEQAKAKNDFPAMIAILEDMASAERIEWRRSDFQAKLLELYQKTGDKEKEKDLLETLLLQHNVQSVKYLRRLRDFYTKKQWNTLRELYLSQHPDLKPEIYFEEKLYDRLMDSLKEQPIEVIDHYREDMANRYPRELRELYLRYLQKLERVHPSNSLYQKMKEYLMITASIKGGKQESLKLIRQWKIKYPTRGAMLKMLEEAENSLEKKR